MELKMIKMKNLTLGYKKEKILSKLNLKIKEGEFVGIIGPSGAGKSTLLMSVVGGIKVFDGHFEVLNYNMDNIKKKDLVSLREQIGIIFQGYNLVDRLSVLDNVISGILKEIPMARAVIKYYREKELKKVQEFMNIVDIQKLSLKRCDELSGGQRQRVAIARALASDPKIILADEPISALDQKSAKKVMQILEKVNKELKVTIIANLHHLEVAEKYCSRIIGINSGKVIFDGTPSDLTEKIIEQIYEGESINKEIED
jgi:phosphonate transport system ATP-binding protein